MDALRSLAVPSGAAARAAGPRGRRRRRPVLAAAGAALLLAALGCKGSGTVLYPHDPPPNVPPGLTLLELPDDVVESLATRRVKDALGTRLLAAAVAPEQPKLPPERREQILQHRVVTGMTVQEVIFCFLADPDRERLQGPPGGRTLLWEPRDARLGRYWVRFDATGRAADAGRY